MAFDYFADKGPSSQSYVLPIEQCFSRSVSSNDFSRVRDPKTVVLSNMRKNIFSKMKRIRVGNTSRMVYVNILEGNSRLCQVIAVI